MKIWDLAQKYGKTFFVTRDSRCKEFKEECKRIEKSSEWVLGTISEAYEKVVKEEAGSLSIVREILRKSTDFLRRIIASFGGRRRVILSNICPHCSSFLLEDFFCWVSTTNEVLQMVVCNLWRKI